MKKVFVLLLMMYSSLPMAQSYNPYREDLKEKIGLEYSMPDFNTTKIDSDVASGKTPYLIRTLIYEMLNVLCWGKVLNAIDDPELVKKAIDIAKYNHEKKVEERKNKKNL